MKGLSWRPEHIIILSKLLVKISIQRHAATERKPLLFVRIERKVHSGWTKKKALRKTRENILNQYHLKYILKPSYEDLITWCTGNKHDYGLPRKLCVLKIAIAEKWLWIWSLKNFNVFLVLLRPTQQSTVQL